MKITFVKRKLYIVAMILLLIGFWSLITYEDIITKPTVVEMTNGYIDLSQWDFEQKGSVALEGQALFYPSEFYTYDRLIKADTIDPVSIELPYVKRTRKTIEASGAYGTLVLRVTLPDNAKQLALRTRIILSAYDLYINDEKLAQVGQVSHLKTDYFPQLKVTNTFFHTHEKELMIIYHASDFDYYDMALNAPVLGLSNAVMKQSQIALSRDLFLFGIVFIMSIYHMGIFVLRTKDPAPFYFSLFGLFFGFRLLIVGERFLPNLINFPMTIYAKASYIFVFLGVASLYGFLYYTLPKLFSLILFRVNTVIATLCVLLILILPSYLNDMVLILFAIWGVTMLLYAIVKLIIGVRQKIPYATGVFVGFFVLTVTLINDLIYQFSMDNTASLIPVGIAFFILIESYALSYKLTLSFEKAELLDRENKRILSELVHMNANLENIVSERTKALRSALIEVELLSKTDHLTGLPNRRSMMKHLEQYMAIDEPFFVAILDVDHFKAVNDTYGHDIGDSVLIELAHLMEKHIEQFGIAGRWGGEEFVIVFNRFDNAKAHEALDTLRAKVEAHPFEGIEGNITLTIGYTKHDGKSTLDAAIATADRALYEGKNKGRNTCLFVKTKY